MRVDFLLYDLSNSSSTPLSVDLNFIPRIGEKLAADDDNKYYRVIDVQHHLADGASPVVLAQTENEESN